MLLLLTTRLIIAEWTVVLMTAAWVTWMHCIGAKLYGDSYVAASRSVLSGRVMVSAYLLLPM